MNAPLKEFSDSLEHEATQSGKLLITGDFNIHWDNKKDNEVHSLV